MLTPNLFRGSISLLVTRFFGLYPQNDVAEKILREYSDLKEFVMNNLTGIIQKNLAIICVVAVILILLKRVDLFIGIFLGMATGLSNFFVLQLLVKSTFITSTIGSDNKIPIKQILLYVIQSFLKLLLLAVILYVFVQFLKVSWLGLLIGLLITMVVYVVETVRNRQCQLHQNQ